MRIGLHCLLYQPSRHTSTLALPNSLSAPFLECGKLEMAKKSVTKVMKQENKEDRGRGMNNEVTEGNKALGNSRAIIKISNVLIILTLYNVSITRAPR